MLIEILKQTSIAGRPARVGDVVEVSESVARRFLCSGRAQLPKVIDQPAPTPRKPRSRIEP